MATRRLERVVLTSFASGLPSTDIYTVPAGQKVTLRELWVAATPVGTVAYVFTVKTPDLIVRRFKVGTFTSPGSDQTRLNYVLYAGDTLRFTPDATLGVLVHVMGIVLIP